MTPPAVQLTLVQLSLLTVIVNWGGDGIAVDVLLAFVPDARESDIDTLIAAGYVVRGRERNDVVLIETRAGFLHCTGYMHPSSFRSGSHS
jgi:hypothetical protein